MLKAAKKYKLDLDPPTIDTDIKRDMPVWYHKGTLPGKTISHRGKHVKCLKAVHKIKTAGDLSDFVEADFPPGHRQRGRCECPRCTDMRQQGCNHLQGCIKTGKQVLDSLQPRWDPRRQLSRTQPESMPFEEDETELLTHMNTGQNLWSEFRVFTEPRAHQVESAVRPPPEPEQETITVHIAAKMKTSKESEPQPVSGLWYGDGDGRNTRFTSTRASTDTTICTILVQADECV